MAGNTPRKKINALFPITAANLSLIAITSPEDWRYNCVAWAAGITNDWLEPSPAGNWPIAKSGFDVAAYAEMFASFGYADCRDGSIEPGMEKIVIYGDNNGQFRHVARQLADGRWTSKLGELSDIRHKTPSLLSSSGYGKPLRYMWRPIPLTST